MNDETGKRIADYLERIAMALEKYNENFEECMIHLDGGGKAFDVNTRKCD